MLAEHIFYIIAINYLCPFLINDGKLKKGNNCIIKKVLFITIIQKINIEYNIACKKCIFL